MTQVDLHSFGFRRHVVLHGTIEATWRATEPLVFLCGERHSDQEMKRLNVLNACTLADAGVVGWVGTEIPMFDLDGLSEELIETRSRKLLEEHKTDDAVIAHLRRTQPFWYGFFEFGNTLRVLRPSLPVRCVEDLVLREKMQRLSKDYFYSEAGAGPHPSPEHPNLGDHPHNLKREKAMIDNTFGHWNETAPALGAILNTGLAHSHRIATGLRERGIGYIHITIPASSSPF